VAVCFTGETADKQRQLKDFKNRGANSNEKKIKN
jgi:hypothetical protein